MRIASRIRNRFFIIVLIYNHCIICENLFYTRECPRVVMVKAIDCGIVVSEFVLQLCYYVHLWMKKDCQWSGMITDKT